MDLDLSIETIRTKLQLTELDAPIPSGYKCAAVLLLLVFVDDCLNLLFTKRTATVRDHQNQVSFPGGVCEAVDGNLLDTALREAKEEIGLEIPHHDVLGNLKARETITQYFIAPFVAFINSELIIQSNPAEVLKVIKVPLSWLSDEKNYIIKPYQRPGFALHDVLFFKAYEGEVIWGITAQIVLDFFEQIKK